MPENDGRRFLNVALSLVLICVVAILVIQYRQTEKLSHVSSSTDKLENLDKKVDAIGAFVDFTTRCQAASGTIQVSESTGYTCAPKK